jgi:RNA polymerase sigma factor (sigma-70 family)
MGRRPRLVPISSIRQGDEADGTTLERVSAAGQVIGGADLGRGPEGELESLEVRVAIRTALDGMPETERTVILMAYRDQLTQSEIADRLGWPLGTVKTRTRRALLHLRDILGPGFGPEPAVPLAMVPASNRSDETNR